MNEPSRQIQDRSTSDSLQDQTNELVTDSANLEKAKEALKVQKAKTIEKLGIANLVLGILYAIIVSLRFNEQFLASVGRFFFASIIIIPINIILLIVCIVMRTKNNVESMLGLILAIIGTLLPLGMIAIGMIP